MKKRAKKKYIPFVPSRMSLVQIEGFMEPFKTFLEQVETDNVWCDNHGNVLMDLLGDISVEDAVKKGEQPLRATPNLALVLEACYQVARLTYSQEFYEKLDDEIGKFTRKFLKPIELNSPVQKSALTLAWGLHDKMKGIFKQAHVNDISAVYLALKTMLDNKETKDMRAWIEPYIAERNTKKGRQSLSTMAA